MTKKYEGLADGTFAIADAIQQAKAKQYEENPQLGEDEAMSEILVQAAFAIHTLVRASNDAYEGDVFDTLDHTNRLLREHLAHNVAESVQAQYDEEVDA